MNNQNISQLNLARKWRSRTFDEIVGQDITIRLLKNTLYRDYFFPVYLLSGQKGTGKTSTARVFSAAVNCAALPAFRQRPQDVVLPCGVCDSCVVFFQKNHPDVIEIDAASNTGVDNIRDIIESSTFLPVMGNKKIYLIDEAHMLSKAAFNAFLKVLEEPPDSVIFLLATTDPQKILPTVTSRSFQLFFEPVQADVLSGYLAQICKNEQIVYEDAAISLLVQESGGSVRDALNMLERVHLVQKKVTKQSAMTILGHIEESSLLTFFHMLVSHEQAESSRYLYELQLHQYNAVAVWKRLVLLIRALVWAKFGMCMPEYNGLYDELQRVANAFSSDQLVSMLRIFYESEHHFSRTIAQDAYIESVIFKCMQFLSHRHEMSMHDTTVQAPHTTAGAEKKKTN
jgi:DNA polymerase-3 subunit gamma/tau